MNGVNDSLHQTHPIQKNPNSSFKSLNTLALFTVLILIAGTGGYWLITNQILPQFEIISQPALTVTATSTTTVTATPTVSPTIDNTATVIIQDYYFFKVTIPSEYKLIKGKGDYIRYITNRSGEKIIGFYISSGLGEGRRTGQIVIDGVPFTVMYTYRGIISCPVDLYATNAQFKRGHLYFGIITWCKDAHEEQDDVYERVIRSIRFSEDLRAVLLGKLPPPMLRY